MKKKVVAIILSFVMLLSLNVPVFASSPSGTEFWGDFFSKAMDGAESSYNYLTELKKKAEALEKQFNEAQKNGDTSQAQSTQAELEKVLEQINVINSGGELKPIEGEYKFAYFPSLGVTSAWSNSSGNWIDGVIPGEIYKTTVNDMNQYGIIDHIKKTLKLENTDIDKVILYNYNVGEDTADFPEGPVFPVRTYKPFQEANLSNDCTIQHYIEAYELSYPIYSTTDNKIQNYVWNKENTNGSFDKIVRLVTCEGKKLGYPVTAEYFEALRTLNAVRNTMTSAEYNSRKGKLQAKFRMHCDEYGMPSNWYEDIITKTNNNQINLDGSVQNYVYYTLQFYVVKYKDGGDLFPPSISLTPNDSSTQLTGPTPGEKHCIEFTVKNNGETEIGAEPAKGNDKVRPLLTVIDKKTNQNILQKYVQATENIEPGKTITLKVCDIQIDTPEIKACVNVDPEKNFNEVGLNSDTTNDVLCKIFKTVQDMGMTQSMSFTGPSGVGLVTKGAKHDIVVYPKHVVGNLPVGTDEIKNPKATVDLKIKTLDGKVIYTETDKTTEILNPKGNVPVYFNDVTINEPQIEVCATVNKIHEEKGWNLDNGNDTYCEKFGATRNFAMKDFKITPSLIYSDTGLTKTLSFTFTVANEAPKTNITPAPIIVIRQDGRVIWSKSIGITDGETITMTQQISVPLDVGSNSFEVEVNPDRSIPEYRLKGDPYADNKKSATATVQKLQTCVQCKKVNTSNKWQREFNVVIKVGEPYEYEVCDSRDKKGNCTSSHMVEACHIEKYQTDTKTLKFEESYSIKNILFRSKYTKDKDKSGDGWVDLKKSGKAVIKAGYGFELAILTEYSTNRKSEYDSYRTSFNPVPPFYVNRCTYGTISPMLDPVEQPSKISVKFPFINSSSKCYDLSTTQQSGPWYNSAYIFELPYRKSLSGSSNVRMIYINERAAAGTESFSITTQQWLGYEESGVTKEKLQDCGTYSLKVLANDDLHGHLVN